VQVGFVRVHPCPGRWEQCAEGLDGRRWDWADAGLTLWPPGTGPLLVLSHRVAVPTRQSLLHPLHGHGLHRKSFPSLPSLLPTALLKSLLLCRTSLHTSPPFPLVPRCGCDFPWRLSSCSGWVISSSCVLPVLLIYPCHWGLCLCCCPFGRQFNYNLKTPTTST
jgi:hypothetical protein